MLGWCPVFTLHAGYNKACNYLCFFSPFVDLRLGEGRIYVFEVYMFGIYGFDMSRLLAGLTVRVLGEGVSTTAIS